MKRIIGTFDKALDGMALIVGCILIFIMLSVCAGRCVKDFF